MLSVSAFLQKTIIRQIYWQVYTCKQLLKGIQKENYNILNPFISVQEAEQTKTLTIPGGSLQAHFHRATLLHLIIFPGR